jgi:hypothetical protein
MKIRLYGRGDCRKCSDAKANVTALMAKLPGVEFEYKDIDAPQWMAEAADHDAGDDLPVMVFIEHSKFDTSDVVRVFRGASEVRSALASLVLEDAGAK